MPESSARTIVTASFAKMGPCSGISSYLGAFRGLYSTFQDAKMSIHIVFLSTR